MINELFNNGGDELGRRVARRETNIGDGGDTCDLLMLMTRVSCFLARSVTW